MEPFLEFAGNYWWLAFPLFGIASAAASAWERGARRRHRRRLETIRAKGEVKAAQAAARGVGRRPSGTAEIEDAPHSQLERLFTAHDAVTAQWLEYELDVAKIIAFPAMSDGRQPLTAAFLRAKRVADGLRPASAKARLTPEQLREYRDAVTDFEVAFEVAERDARRLKDSSFTASERKRLDKAQQLLTIAIDEAATPAERQLAYKRVREELDGLISLSDDAIDSLEQKVALELPRRPDADGPGASTSPPTAASPAPAAPPRPADPPRPVDLPPAAPREPGMSPWPVPKRDTTPPGRVTHPKHTS